MFDPSFSLAKQNFQQARFRAGLEEILARLGGRSADLLSYQEVCQKLRASGSASGSVQDIPLDAIVGSVGRYSDFTRSFLPRQDCDRERWARVERAMMDLSAWPPIEVYQIDQAYFVLDGNHRVSIARQQGLAYITAYVTQVRTKVPLSPDVQPDELILKAEYAAFLEYTRLDQHCPGADLTVSVPGQYARFENHIEVHRYFMEVAQEQDIPFDQAACHWYTEAYVPVVQVIRDQDLLRDFPGRTEADLYIWIIEHRVELEKALGWKIRPESAATDLVAHRSPNAPRVLTRLKWKAGELLTPDPFKAGPAPGQWRREHLTARRGGALFADILTPVTGDEAGWRALDQALHIARREGGNVHGLHVITAAQNLQAIQAEFARHCQAANAPGKLAIETGKTSLAPSVCERAWWMDLVVLKLDAPPQLRSLARLSSELRAILWRCPRPVLALPGKPSALERALLAYDGSPKAEEALFIAAHLSIQWKTQLVVVNVTDKDDGQRSLKRAQERLEACQAPTCFVHKSGPVAETLLKAAREYESDVLIMGGYGANPFWELVRDSRLNRVLRASWLPVLICR